MNSKTTINLKITLFTLALLLSATGCEHASDCAEGHGSIVTQEMVLNEVNGIHLMGDDVVYLSIGKEQKVIVEGQQNIINELDTRIHNGTWDIRFRDCVRKHRRLEFHITIKEIDNIRLSGSGEIILEDIIAEDFLRLELAGSGEIKGVVQAQEISMDIAGSGNLILSGQASEADLKIAGSGELRAFELKVNNYEVDISGSGNADITALAELKVNIAGSGSVNYKGNPIINSNISGSGKINNNN